MVKIEYFSIDLRARNIKQTDLACNAPNQRSVRYGCANATGADDPDLSHTSLARLSKIIHFCSHFRYAHSPLRISGSSVPVAVTPSISSSPDPIIQST